MSDPAAKTIPAATPVNASASDKGPASETLTPTVQLAKLAFEKLWGSPGICLLGSQD